MIDWNTIIVAIIGSSGLSAIIVKLIDVINNKKEKKDCMQTFRDTILMSVAADILINKMKECIHNEYMDIHTRRFCETLYHAYKGMKGNGLVDSLWEQCKSLPLEPQ